MFIFYFFTTLLHKLDCFTEKPCINTNSSSLEASDQVEKDVVYKLEETLNQEKINKEGFYLKVFGGVNTLHSPKIYGNTFNYKSGLLIGTHSGYHWEKYLTSLEGEISYRLGKIESINFSFPNQKVYLDDGENHQLSLMTNIIKEFGHKDFKTVPYTGFGLGITYIHQNFKAQELYDNTKIVGYNLSSQFFLGIKHQIDQQSDFSVEYRYLDSGANLKNSGLTLGLNWKF